jgi:hypothetical protein
MKAGDVVRPRAPVIVGVIKQRRFTPDDELEFLVEWVEDGEAHHRWYEAGQLELVPATDKEAAP